MKNNHRQDVELLFEAILSLQSTEECDAFSEDICTIKELQAMAQRFLVACQLNANKNYLEVSENTGASSATISRVNKCLLYGKGGYKMVIDRLKTFGKLENDT